MINVKISNPVTTKLKVYKNNKSKLALLQKDFFNLSRVPSPLFWSYVFTKVGSNKEELVGIIDDILKALERQVDEYTVINGVAEQVVAIMEEQVTLLLAMKTMLKKVYEVGSFEQLSSGDRLYWISKDGLKNSKRT